MLSIMGAFQRANLYQPDIPEIDKFILEECLKDI